MPKKPKARIGRPPMPRAAKKSQGIGIRVRAELREALEASANERGHSLSSEVARRLQGSLSEEIALGGPDMRDIVLTMISRFHNAGQQSAELKLGLDVKPAQWLKDPDCYDDALLSLFDTLWARRPARSEESDAAFFERVAMRMVSDWWKQKRARMAEVTQ